MILWFWWAVGLRKCKRTKKKKKSFLCWSSASCFWFCVSCLPVKMSVLHIVFVSFRFWALKIFKCLFCLLVLTSHRSPSLAVSYCCVSSTLSVHVLIMQLLRDWYSFFFNWWERKIGCVTQTLTTSRTTAPVWYQIRREVANHRIVWIHVAACEEHPVRHAAASTSKLWLWSNADTV